MECIGETLRRNFRLVVDLCKFLLYNIVMKKLEQFQKAHEEAMDEIASTIQRGDEFAEVVKYLLETDANPYSFLPHGWAGSVGTSTAFVSLTNMLHHALYDDGDISFPVVNGEPRISFYWKHEDDYHNLVLTDTEKHMRDNFGTTYKVTQLNNVMEFISAHKEYHRSDVLDCFIQDAAIHGVVFAESVYSKYANFRYEWSDDEETLARIEELRNKRKKAGLA